MSDEKRGKSPLDIVGTLPNHWGYIFRHYNHPERKTLANDLAKICRRRGIMLLVAGDWRLACKVGADGAHMPEWLMKSRPVSPCLLHFRSKIITTSAHGPSGLRQAFRLSVNAAFLSPVYPTPSHPTAMPIGRQAFAALVRSSLIPVYALGGVRQRDRLQLMAVGASGIAGIRLAEESA